MSFGNPYTAPANGPTAAAIGQAVASAQGLIVPALDIATAIANAQGVIGSDATAQAAAAYLAGTRIIDTPGPISGDQQALPVYAAVDGGYAYPPVGGSGPVSYDVRQWHGWQFSGGISSGSRGGDYCLVRMTWYNAPGTLYPGAITHQEVFEFTNGLAYGLGSVYASDRHHGPYLTIQMLAYSTNGTPNPNAVISWQLMGTNREQDRFRLGERLDYHENNPSGNDGVLLQTPSGVNIPAGPSAGVATTQYIGVCGLYSGEVSLLLSAISPTAGSMPPGYFLVALGSVQTVGAVIPLTTMATGPNGKTYGVTTAYLNFPRRPVTLYYVNPSNTALQAFASVVASEC